MHSTFAEMARRHELGYQVTSEGTPVWPPRGDPSLRWLRSAGAGTVFSVTVLRPRGGDPRSLCLVTLDEGFRMMSAVEGADPAQVRIGDRVLVSWAPGDPPLPVFRPIPA